MVIKNRSPDLLQVKFKNNKIIRGKKSNQAAYLSNRIKTIVLKQIFGS